MTIAELAISSDISEVSQIHGHLKTSGSQKSHPLLLRIEHPRYDHSRISCQLIAPGGYDGLREASSAALLAPEHGITIESVDFPEYECQLWAVRGSSSNANTVELNSDWYELGFRSWSQYDLPKPKTLLATVELAPSGILENWGIAELRSDGSIRKRGGDRRSVLWSLEAGKVEALERCVYERGNLAENETLLQIARPCLLFTLKLNQVESPWKAFEIIKEEAKDVCRVLSICYRRLVNWYEITLHVNHKDIKHAALPMPKCRRVLPKRPNEGRTEPLIDRRHLIDGGFERLLVAYRSGKGANGLDKVIPFLVAAHNYHSLETGYFLCYAALETVTNSMVRLSGSKPVPNHISDRIKHCVRHFAIETDDLWVKIGFDSGISRALAHRNKLFHGASVEDHGELYASLIRIRTLTERFAIACLKWPKELLWVHRDDDLHRLLE